MDPERLGQERRRSRAAIATADEPSRRRGLGCTLAFWAEAARLRTLPASAAPVLIGIVMAAGAGRAHLGAALAALFGAVLIQVGTNFANDYFDFLNGADRPGAPGRRRLVPSGAASPRLMGRAAAVAFTLAALVGLYLVARGGWPILAVGVAAILSGVLYTGGPLPYGYRGLGDVFVLVFFGPVAVAGTYYVQALELDWAPVVAGLGPGLISTGILAVNNLRDAEADARAGKRTLAVIFGRGFVRGEYAAALGLAALVPVALVAVGAAGPWAALPLLTLPAAVPVLRVVLRSSDPARLDAALESTGKLLVLYTALFCLGWML